MNGETQEEMLRRIFGAQTASSWVIFRREQARSAAAWVVTKHRRQIRKMGGVRFELPPGAEMPSFMSEAIKALVEPRPRREWSVEPGEVRDDGGSSFILWWHGSKHVQARDRRRARNRKKAAR